MFIILHGEDTFRSGAKVKELEDAYKEKHKGGFSYEKVDGEFASFREIKNALQSYSLFDTAKFVLGENILENKNVAEELFDSEVIKDIRNTEDIFFVLREKRSISAKNKLYEKALKSASKQQEFKPLSVTESAKWFGTFFKGEGIDIDTNITRKVIDMCGGDMWQSYNELQKLYTYRKGRDVKESDFNLFHIGNEEAQVFPTVDAVFEGNIDNAMRLMHLHWNQGEHPQQIFYMLERQLKLVALVKAEEERGQPAEKIAKEHGMHPYPVKKTKQFIKNFPWDNIQALYDRVVSLDRKSKTGEIEPRLAAELLATTIARSAV